jgi:hypothetical protein
MDFPAAIPEFIILIMIDSAYMNSASRSLRTVTHISEEISQVEPFFTDSNATTAVSRVRGVPGAKATGHHPMPGTVSPGMFSFYPAAFICTRELTLHLATGKPREIPLSFFGVVSAAECSDLPFLELAGVSKCMLITSTSIPALEGLSMFFGKWCATLGDTNVKAPTLPHVKIMSGALTERRALWSYRSVMSATGTFGFTLRHSSIIPYIKEIA